MRVMATYRELLARVKEEIDEVGAAEARERQGEALFVDVREKDETKNGYVPGAVLLPRGFLEMQNARASCPTAPRSSSCTARAVCAPRSPEALQDLGYTQVESANPGFVRWKDGYPMEIPAPTDARQRERYSRHLLFLKSAKRVRRSCSTHVCSCSVRAASALLRRSISRPPAWARSASSTPTRWTRRICSGRSCTAANGVGTPKVDSAEKTIKNLNPDVKVIKFQERHKSGNIDRILDQGWDVIVDGDDNFPTRYLLNDASVWKKDPRRSRLPSSASMAR